MTNTQDSSSVPSGDLSDRIDSPAVRPRWGMISVACVVFVILELTAFIFVVPEINDMSIAFRFGILGVLGFWLACGRARWWLRCIVVVVVLPVMVLLDRDDSGDGLLFFSVAIVLFTGITFLLRGLISLWERSSNRHHTISLRGIIFAIVGAAILFACLRGLGYFDGSGGALFQSARILFNIFILGTAYQMHSAVLWGRGRMRVRLWFGALLYTSLSFVSLYSLNHVYAGEARILEWLVIYGMGLAAIWLTAYPLDAVLRRLGWSLVQPSWYLGSVAEAGREAATDQMSHTTERLGRQKSADTSVDFNDMV